MSASAPLPHILIVGRPNVGKSSLFNRLAGRKAAIVHNRRGVTRDIKTELVERHGLRFYLGDSAGLEEVLEQALDQGISAAPDNGNQTGAEIGSRQLIEDAINTADLILMMVDAQKGITAGDQEIVDWLRRFNRPTLLLLNKSEGRLAEPLEEAYRLGFDNILPISATHNRGIAELLTAIEQRLPGTPAKATQPDPPRQDGSIKTPPDEPVTRCLAILGRPNVGKSTISNVLLGKARLVSGGIAGLTRDANELAWPAASDDYQRWSLVDTAGLRAHGQYRDSLDRATAEATWRAIGMADVVALVIEATAPLTRGDLGIAKDCARLGRPMLLVVNKTDLVDDVQTVARELAHQLVYDLAQLRRVPYVCVSALTQQGLEQIAPIARQQANRAAVRIGTGTLNRWLEQMLAAHPPPLIKGRRLRLKYMTQTEVSPPQFVFFSSQKTSVPETYIRYLRNGLIDDFDFDGIPLRLSVRAARNPYDIGQEGRENKTGHPRQKHAADTRRLPKSQQRRARFAASPEKVLSLKGRAKEQAGAITRRQQARRSKGSPR